MTFLSRTLKEEGVMAVIVRDIQQLRKPTQPCNDSDDVAGIAQVLLSEMKDFNAQGLAANQLGYDRSIMVMMMNQYTPLCIVNPVIVKEKGWTESNELCLSLPGIKVRVKRPQMVRVKGFNQYWNQVSYKFEGIEARRACHEIDHLGGKLIIDYEKEE